jgi:hypothetical protein
MDDGTFPALLKTLSDPSEEVVKSDLQLLAQISSSSEEENFTSFMVNLLSLFSTDRRLLETRGSLIIRQLCLSLNSERIYRTFAEILEKDEVRERFAWTYHTLLTYGVTRILNSPVSWSRTSTSYSPLRQNSQNFERG